ncbi:MAG: F0F1 ATP synthase subunit A [Patescibacteria group bacterium]|nr:F0F1 ATP synthase subunit A [Patescibacteria group bacterium]
MTIETNNQIQNTAQPDAATLAGETVTDSETTSSVHQPTLFAEPVFNIGSFTVTNSLLSSWIVLSVILLIAVAIRLSLKKVPRGIQNYFEVVVDGALNLADSVTGSRAKSMKFFPIVFPLFLFILLNNWLGILPGVGSIGFNTIEEGHQIFIPFLRGGTADLNTTLALAIVVVIATHVASIAMTSTWQYLNRFIGIDLFLELPKKIFKHREFTAVLVNPIKFLVGLIEIVGEFAKVASLSFRLFGNIFAGEVLLGAMAMIFAYILPVPFIFLEIIVGLVQAMIFSILTLAFLTVMTIDHGEAH